jgi:hypothetical protein
MQPTDQTFTQSFLFNATTTNLQISPNNPKRNYLLIQNNGTHPLLIQFDRVTGDGTEFNLAAATAKEWSFKVPIGSVNLAATSAGATSGVVIEGMPPPGSKGAP